MTTLHGKDDEQTFVVECSDQHIRNANERLIRECVILGYEDHFDSSLQVALRIKFPS